jgi:hypothetical protein
MIVLNLSYKHDKLIRKNETSSLAEQSRQELGNRGAMVSEIELTDSDDHRQQLPPLQRIDEESEFEGSIVNSATGSHFDQERNIIPRSISQQVFVYFKGLYRV